MKRTLSLLLVLVLCLSLCACGKSEDAFDKSEEAFEKSKEAFEKITAAYLETNEFSEDIYEAWYLGVNDRHSYDSSSEFGDFCDEMNIDREYIEQAVAKLSGNSMFSTADWYFLPGKYNNSYFSAWVSVISEAYKCGGQADSIRGKLNDAKDLMKGLSSDYSDYEHYPALKEYFTNTLAFYDFCCNPEGSFEQVVQTFNTYRNNARESFFDLNYIFGDSVGGMSEYTKPEKEETE